MPSGSSNAETDDTHGADAPPMIVGGLRGRGIQRTNARPLKADIRRAARANQSLPPSRADRRRLVSGFASSLAALNGEVNLHRARLRLAPAVERHLDERGTSFRAVVHRKRELRSARREPVARGEVQL